MAKEKLRRKYYMVMANNKNMGAFPFSQQGKKNALEYLKKLAKESDGKFILVEG